MRKLIVISMISLDGVIQSPGAKEEDTGGGFSHGGWVAPHFDEFLNKIVREQMARPFELLLGRKTYDIFAGYWPQNEDKWPGVNKLKKYVASRNTSFSPGWNNTELVTGDIAEAINKLKKEDRPDLNMYGSADFIQTLLKNDLIDELWLRIFPVTIGEGKKLFEDGPIPASFKLTECQASPSGVIEAHYRRDGNIRLADVT